MARVTYTEPQVGDPKTAASVNDVTAAMGVQSSRLDRENYKTEAFDFTSFAPEAISLCKSAAVGVFDRELFNLTAPASQSGDWNLDGTDETGITLNWGMAALPMGLENVLRVRFYCQVRRNNMEFPWGGILGAKTAEVRLRLEDGFGNLHEIEGTRRWVGYTNTKAAYQIGNGDLATSCMLTRETTIHVLSRGIRKIFPVFTFPSGTASTAYVEYHGCHLDVVRFGPNSPGNIEMSLV